MEAAWKTGYGEGTREGNTFSFLRDAVNVTF